jgi:hypothetical protein
MFYPGDWRALLSGGCNSTLCRRSPGSLLPAGDHTVDSNDWSAFAPGNLGLGAGRGLDRGPLEVLSLVDPRCPAIQATGNSLNRDFQHWAIISSESEN